MAGAGAGMADEYDEIARPEHYVAAGGIEPFDFIDSNALGFAAGNVVKYVFRFSRKGGVVDLLKARWYLDRLIEQARTGANDEGN
jgi:hypothetical protein